MVTKTNIFSFRYSKEDLTTQVDNYSDLKLTKSARGECVIFFGILNIFSLLLVSFTGIFGISFFSAFLEVLILYVPLLFFAYRGHRWAFVGLILVWTGEKAYGIANQLSTGGSIISILFFLVIGVGLCMRAIQVENTRKEIQTITLTT